MLREGPVLRLEEAWRDDAGSYMCMTNGEAEQRQGTSFTLHVQCVCQQGGAGRGEGWGRGRGEAVGGVGMVICYSKIDIDLHLCISCK